VAGRVRRTKAGLTKTDVADAERELERDDVEIPWTRC
jgi:hypothetical protein